MLEMIQDLPDDTVGIAVRGKMSHEDYERFVIPAMQDKLENHDKIKVLFHLADFNGIEMAALWDDAKFGLSHWRDFSKLALVTEDPTMKNMSAFFAWMVPAEVKIFELADIGKARKWLAGTA